LKRVSTTENNSSVAAFGSVFTSLMAVADFADGAWGTPELVPVAPIPMHPAAHVLHYASCCFEGLKAYRHPDGAVRLFRMDRNVARMRQSAQLLYLAVPGEDMLTGMILDTTRAARDEVPGPPGALYLRPTLIGTTPNVGAAASPSTECKLFVLASPVGDYFGGSDHATRILMADDRMRSTPGFGMAKAGANYAQALGHVMQAKAEHNVDTVLFAPDGDVQETGASNFILLNDHEIVTKPLDSSYLHGVTRDSVLTLGAHLGYEVSERPLSVDDVLGWIDAGGEAALTGTAAVLAGVGTIIYKGKEHTLRNGAVGHNTQRLRQALTDIQTGQAEDPFGWLQEI
jgi:branched-chain amino acid aminotransferase